MKQSPLVGTGFWCDMADILVDKRAINLDISDRFEGYSRVVIKTGETDIDGN